MPKNKWKLHNTVSNLVDEGLFIYKRLAIVEIDFEKNMWFEMYICVSLFVTLAHAGSSWKSLNHKINHKKKAHEIHMRKNSRPAKYPWIKYLGHMKCSKEKGLDPQNTREKNFGPTKHPREKNFDPLNTHEGTIVRWRLIHETHDSTWAGKFSSLYLL